MSRIWQPMNVSVLGTKVVGVGKKELMRILKFLVCHGVHGMVRLLI